MERPYHEITSILSSGDDVLKNVIRNTEEKIEPTPSVDIYRYLMEAIVSQQLSTKVADVIWGRFANLFEETYPHPEAVVEMDDQELRNVGLSWQKLGYLKNVARFSLENDISFEALGDKDDNEIIELLTEIKGVGKWTVQMVLMFPLDRPDVFPVDDLGIQTKMKHWYELDSEKKELKQELVRIAETWRPYRTLACKYLWSSVIPKTKAI